MPRTVVPLAMQATDNLRIESIQPVSTPEVVRQELPLNPTVANTVEQARHSVASILAGEDDRLLAIVGPCSIHDPVAAKDYAQRLAGLRDELQDDIVIIMRVYFEKPRTTVGWKGLINDPDLDDSYQINKGLRVARGLLLDLNKAGMPAGVEYLDILTPQYISDLVSWGAIGARTTESQLHREMSSGLSCPVGFKNGTDGNVKVAVDAIQSARNPHRFLSATVDGVVSIFKTTGNQQTHVILRGGNSGPNYEKEHIDSTAAALEKAKLPAKIMVDCSHANSQKKHDRQLLVAQDLGQQIAAGDERIFGVMVESHLVEGRQDIVPGEKPTYGQSITDACLGWEHTEEMLRGLASAVRTRREKQAK